MQNLKATLECKFELTEQLANNASQKCNVFINVNPKGRYRLYHLCSSLKVTQSELKTADNE